MTTVIYAWRAILWSWVVASMSARPLVEPKYVMYMADELLKGFDERFTIDASGSILPKKVK